MGTRARIAALAYRTGRLGRLTQEEMIGYTFDMVDQLGNSRADLICLPEEVLISAGDKQNARWAENNARLLDGLRARAAAMRAMIACCVEEPSEKYPDMRYNTAYLIGRDGEYLAKYRKMHVTFRAIEGNGLAGHSLCAVDTDIGRIGMQTCFDIGWREPWSELARMGCELVLWNAAYDGGSLLNAYAAHNMYFIASSVWSDHAKIIDPVGRTVEESSRWDGFAIADVDLGLGTFHVDRQEDRPERLRRALGDKVTIRSYSQENIFTVASNDGAWPMERVIREFDLTTYQAYHDEYTRANDALRARYPE